MLNILVCAVLFRPLKWELEEDEEEEEEEEEDEEDEEEEEDEVEDTKHAAASNPNHDAQGENRNTDENNNLLTKLTKKPSNNKLKAPIAKFDSNSAFSLLDSRIRTPRDRSNSYLMNNDYASDYYLPVTSANEAGVDDRRSIHRHVSEGDLPVNPSLVSLVNMNIEEEGDTAPSKRLLSYANSLISFDRCHSLELKPHIDHQDSMTKVRLNSLISS